MKKFFSTWLLCMSSCILSGCVSTKPIEPIHSTEIVNIPGATKNEIFNRSREFFTTYFVSGESVVDYENKDAGTIIGKGIADNGSLMKIIPFRINFKIKVDTKDQKMRITGDLIKYTEYNQQYSLGYTTSTYITPEREKNAIITIKKVMTDLKAYVLRNKEDSNW